MRYKRKIGRITLKTVRRKLLHVAGYLVRHVRRVLSRAYVLLAEYKRALEQIRSLRSLHEPLSLVSAQAGKPGVWEAAWGARAGGMLWPIFGLAGRLSAPLRAFKPPSPVCHAHDGLPEPMIPASRPTFPVFPRLPWNEVNGAAQEFMAS